jgi:competence protein ComK
LREELGRLKEKLIEEYIINPCTMFIKPEVYGCKIYSMVYELEDEVLVPFKPFDIINASCDFFCASYKGRVQGSHHILGKAHKAPISIDPQNSLYFFPTTSPSRQDCIWVNAQHVDKYFRFTSKITKVLFKNKVIYDIPVSVRTFESQLLKTSYLRTTLIQRMNETEKKSYLYFHKPKFLTVSENSGKNV